MCGRGAGACRTRRARTGGSGAGSGKVVVDDLEITTGISVASPALLRLCARGQHVRTAVLTGVRAGGGPAGGREVYRYTLNDVVVTEVRHGDDPAGDPTEHLVLRARTIEVSYRPQSPTGTAGPAVTVVVGGPTTP